MLITLFLLIVIFIDGSKIKGAQRWIHFYGFSFQPSEICKPFYVRQGLMLGEFHNRNNSPGLRNKNFYPLRTPLPCLAIRHMVPTDIAFLDVDSYELDLRIAFLQSFLKVFGDEKESVGGGTS